MSGNVQEIANAVKDLVATGGQVRGSTLSTQLKVRVPGWNPADFGVRSLREFIANHVAGVIVSGRSGMDVIYSFAGAGSAPANAAAPSSNQVDFWRLWVSPNSPQVLAVDRASAALRSVPRGSASEPGQVLLEPPGVDVHREVAQAFLSRVPPALQVKLQAVLDSTNEQWWQAWLGELRSTEHLTSWQAFRRDSFEKRLVTQLQTAAFERPAIDEILKTVREHHSFVPPRARHIAGDGLKQDGNQQEDEAKLRRVVMNAVQRMSVSELRELRLPIGIVLDVLAPSKSR